jgi:nucleoporin SEH1
MAHIAVIWDVYTDHSVVIWEEREGNFKSLATPDDTMNNNAAILAGGGVTNNASSSSGGDTAASRWVQKATLSDARRAVTTVEFAPRHLGLRLASGSADGVVRIYEALDTMNLNHWKLDGVIEAEVEETTVADNEAGGQQMNIGDNHLLSSNENMGVSSLSWCTGRFEPATLVVGFSSGRASIYRYDDGARSWLEVIRLPNHATANGVPRGVLDVAWAPNVGRSYHLIATCGKDNRLKVHRVKRGRGGGKGEEGGGSQTSASSSLVYEGTEDLDQSEVWRCQWNLTGTVLASSGDCGVVKLWKSDFQGKWKCVSEIVGDTTGMAAASAGRNQ